MQTKIIIEHATVDALKASPLWKQIVKIMFSEGNVSVVEVEAIEPATK